MFANLGSRIAGAYAILMALCVGALTIYLVSVGQSAYVATLEEGVQAQARLVSAAAKPYLEPGRPLSDLNTLARRLGQEAGVRVTIIDRSGAVLGDSEQDPATMENHGNRPEVVAALSGSRAEARRVSTSVGYGTLYVAVPIEDNGLVLGVSRVAVPLARVEAASGQIATAIAVGGLVAIVLVVCLSLLIARSIARPVNELTAVAVQMAEGDLDSRVRSYAPNEVGRLARAFDSMADRLQSTVKTISAERNTLSSVLSTMADGILIVDQAGRVTMANRAAAGLLRIPGPMLEGRSYVEALRDHELSRVMERCIARGSQESGTAEVGPGRRLLRVVAAPLVGEEPGALALIQDLTEVHRADTIRREFVANVSHELRTPLASLKALVETLEEGAIAEPEVAQDFLSKMHSEVDGMAHLVSELLELSRIESGQASLRLEDEDPGDLVIQAAGRLDAQATRAGIALTTDVPDQLPAMKVDGQRVQQVLLNLIHNAIKFTPAGGQIVAGVRQDGDQLLFWVTDTGEGIPAEDLSRVFERFYKANRSRSDSGTGLGLAIAKHVVQAHGGTIQAESTEGQGSTFSFTLPLSQGG